MHSENLKLIIVNKIEITGASRGVSGSGLCRKVFC